MQTLELTHRLKELREKESALTKDIDTYRDQLTRICREKEGLEVQVQRTAEQRDQALTDRAWLGFSATVMLKNMCIFTAGFVTCYLSCRAGPMWGHIWGRQGEL